MLQLSSTVELKIHHSVLRSESKFVETHVGDAVYLTAGQSYIKLKKFPYPRLCISQTSTELTIDYDFGAGEVFTIRLAEQKCSLVTTSFGQLQLFYLCSDEWLLAADSFAGLASIAQQTCQLELDENGVLDWLLLQPNLTKQTILKDIKKLSENSQLVWQGQSWSVQVRHSLEDLVVPFASLNASRMQDEFEQHLLRHITTVATISQAAGWSSCLSGGVDSAVITTCASQVLPTQALSVSAEPESIRVQQQAVLKRIVKKLHVSFVYLSATEIPLLEDLNELLLADPYLDPYANWSIALAQNCSSINNKLVFTGIGGDDFYSAHRQHKLTQQSADTISSSFIVPKVSPNTELQSKRTSVLSPSLSDALLFYQVPWMLCGVWPVSPFVSAESASFSLYLKNAQKQQKQFLREYLEKKLGESFPEWQRKFSLSPVFYAAVTALAPTFSCNELHHQLLALHILDCDAIETTLQLIRKRQPINKQDMRQLFQLYKLNRFLQILDL